MISPITKCCNGYILQIQAFIARIQDKLTETLSRFMLPEIIIIRLVGGSLTWSRLKQFSYPSSHKTTLMGGLFESKSKEEEEEEEEEDVV
jgi:hypothetical protein